MTTGIYDDSGFEALSPERRAEQMSRALETFGKSMSAQNKSVLAKVIDIICEIDPTGNEELRLNLLASHLEKEGPELVDIVLWPPFEDTNLAEITTMRGYLETIDWESQNGVPGWAYVSTEDFLPNRTAEENAQMIDEFLESLRSGVEENASRELLGDALASNIQLPAVFREFYRHTNGVNAINWEKVIFYPGFGFSDPWGKQQALPLEDLEEKAQDLDLIIAAGWCAGIKEVAGQRSYICYVLSRLDYKPEEPWQWRVFASNSDRSRSLTFGSFLDFLDWYSKPYDRGVWTTVGMYLDSAYDDVVEKMEQDSEFDEDADTDEDEEKYIRRPKILEQL